MSKPLEDMTFQELVDHVANNLHSGLLEGGGKEFKGRLHIWLFQTIEWHKKQKEKSK